MPTNPASTTAIAVRGGVDEFRSESVVLMCSSLGRRDRAGIGAFGRLHSPPDRLRPEGSKVTAGGRVPGAERTSVPGRRVLGPCCPLGGRTTIWCMGQIIVGMDESDCAAEALRWAVVEGERREWRVRAVLAWTFLRQHQPDRKTTHDPEYDESSAALALEQYVTDAIGEPPRVQMETVCELPATGLIEASEGASLLVVGSHGYGGISGLVMGSVSQQCLHHTTTPLAIIRNVDKRVDDEHQPVEVVPGKVVVGIDGSDTSRRALSWALDEARARNGFVEVVHSWLLPASYGYPTLMVPDLAIFEEAAEAVVTQFLDAADTSGLSRPVSRVVVGGTSTAGLLAARSADAEVLVVGSRGIGGFGGMVVGSVAHHLAHHALCPLVVIPAASGS